MKKLNHKFKILELKYPLRFGGIWRMFIYKKNCHAKVWDVAAPEQ